jgi:hypothetical protein
MMVLGAMKIKATMVSRHESTRVEKSLVKHGNFKGKFIKLWKVELQAPSSGVLALKKAKV